MHRNNIFHRDIKPENILLLGDHIKLADFGSCKRINSEHPYTEYISTRWYRAPECLLTDGYYDYKMDLWGVGCVMFEIIGLHPLFPGNNELDQVHKIHNILGTPPKEILDRFKKHATHMEFDFQPQHGTGIDKLLVNSNASPDCIDLIRKLLIYDPDQRINANQAINHEYFRELVEQEQYNLLQSNLKTQKVLKKNSMQSGYDDKQSRVGNENLIEDDRSSKRVYNYNKQSSKKSQSIPPPNKKKVETSFKNSYAHDLSTEEETMKFALPQINKPITYAQTLKKTYDPKKMYISVQKNNISNQYLKKPKKGTQSNYQGDYILFGKKAGQANQSYHNNLSMGSNNSSINNVIKI